MIGEELYSRRNRVNLVQHPSFTAVRKMFANAKDYERERAVYALLESTDLPRPRVLQEYTQNCMYYEFIDAPTVCDLIEQAETHKVDEETLIRAYQLMIDWINTFYRATSLSMGDVNARNFLFDGETIYGLDFESTKDDRGVEDDMGQMLAFLMTYHPADSGLKKRHFSAAKHYAVGRWSLKGSDIQDAYIRERLIIVNRRQQMGRQIP